MPSMFSYPKAAVEAGGPHYVGSLTRVGLLNVDRNNWGCATSHLFEKWPSELPTQWVRISFLFHFLRRGVASAPADSTSTRSNSLLSRSVKRQRSSELVAHQPQVSLRDHRPAEQNVRPEIALDGIRAGDNLSTDSVPVQDQG